jgi:hypothetical protein
MSWPESAIEEACRRAEQWYRKLPCFRQQVNLGNVVGFKHPALVSEHDCVIQFARFLNEAGVPWEAMNHELSVSRWLFDKEHPVATEREKARRQGKSNNWRVDLALRDSEAFRNAQLPSENEPGFQFDAFLEFAYLSNFWTLEKVHPFGAPMSGRAKVQKDVEKTAARYLDTHACRLGYVIVFEECDWRFPPTFALDAEREHGCQVRFIRGYRRACPACGSEALLPMVWGYPAAELEQQEREGKVVLGGDLVYGDERDPRWHCGGCQHRWY